VPLLMSGELILAILLIGAGWPLGYQVLEKAMPGYVAATKATKKFEKLTMISFLLGCGVAMGGLVFALLAPLAVAIPTGAGCAVGVLYFFLRYFEGASPEKALGRQEEVRKEVMEDLGIKDPTADELKDLLDGWPGEPVEKGPPEPPSALTPAPPPAAGPPETAEAEAPPEKVAENAGLAVLDRLQKKKPLVAKETTTKNEATPRARRPRVVQKKKIKPMPLKTPHKKGNHPTRVLHNATVERRIRKLEKGGWTLKAKTQHGKERLVAQRWNKDKKKMEMQFVATIDEAVRTMLKRLKIKIL